MCDCSREGGGVLGTPMNEALETLLEVRADTSTDAVVEIESNTLPGGTRNTVQHNNR